MNICQKQRLKESWTVTECEDKNKLSYEEWCCKLTRSKWKFFFLYTIQLLKQLMQNFICRRKFCVWNSTINDSQHLWQYIFSSRIYSDAFLHFCDDWTITLWQISECRTVQIFHMISVDFFLNIVEMWCCHDESFEKSQTAVLMNELMKEYYYNKLWTSFSRWKIFFFYLSISCWDNQCNIFSLDENSVFTSSHSWQYISFLRTDFYMILN